MTALWKKELKGYFLSPLGYIFIAVFMFINAVLFVNGSLAYGIANTKVLYSNINIIFLFLISVLTMRIIAGERKQKTEGLLITSPTTVFEVVIGKFFAAVSVFLAALALSMVFPATLCMLGAHISRELIGGYIGLILLWCLMISIGMFISSLTERQMISATITFAVLMIIYFFDTIISGIHNDEIVAILNKLSVFRRYNEIVSGVFNIENAVFFISLTIIFLILTVFVTDKKRKYKSVMYAAIVLSMIFTNLIAARIGMVIPMKIDITDEHIYSFSEQTENTASRLDKEVDIFAIISKTDNSEYIGYVREYLMKYSMLSNDIKLRFVDPYDEPGTLKKFNNTDNELTIGSVIVSCGEKFEVIPFNRLYKSGDRSVYINIEKLLTEAVIKVTKETDICRIWFSSGHEEYDCSELKSIYEKSGFSVTTDYLSDGMQFDKNSLIIVASPSRDFSENEIQVLNNCSQNGGHIMFLAESGVPIPERLSSFLDDWGIRIMNNYVVEQNASMLLSTPYGKLVPAPELCEHKLTKSINNAGLKFAAPMLCSIECNKNNPYYAGHAVIMRSSPDSWGETDLEADKPKYDENDTKGPLDVCVVGTRENGSNIVVIGSAACVFDNIISQQSYANSDFFRNTASYLFDSGELLDIQPRQVSGRTIAISESQLNAAKIILIYAFPALILLIGLVIWLWRRHL